MVGHSEVMVGMYSPVSGAWQRNGASLVRSARRTPAGGKLQVQVIRIQVQVESCDGPHWSEMWASAEQVQLRMRSSGDSLEASLSSREVDV